MSDPRRWTILTSIVALALAVLLALVPSCGERSAAGGKQVIVLGFDGVDPKLCAEMMADGRLPNLARLADRGGFTPLGTSTPPQSPVAWSTFITGTDPGTHGIFDFIHRDPKTYVPFDSTARTEPGGWPIHLGKWVFQLKSGKVVNLRQGRPFWEYLTEAGIPAQVYHIPAIYPPQESKGAAFCCLTDMGTPDIRGTKGEFSFYTDGPFNFRKTMGGGKAYPIQFEDHTAQAAFYGPPDGLRAPTKDRKGKDRPWTKPTETPFTVYRDPIEPVVRINWQDRDVLLREGEWSDWCPVEFEMGPRLALGDWDIGPLIPGSSTPAICRFYLKRVRPDFELYVSPFNIDPLNPALPISVPDGFAVEVAEAIGRHYTQGLPQDTKALTHNILNRDEFLQQAGLVRDERRRMLDFAMDRFEEGFLFFYFGGTDMVAHMVWGARYAGHPALSEEDHRKYEHVVEGIYEWMDGVVAAVMERFPDATVLVMSDHGFETFTRQFNPNNWLADSGYTTIRSPKVSPGSPLNVLNFDFARSRAYAMGINGLYLNLQGREGQGIVPPSEKDTLLGEIAAGLLEYRDPDTGQPVVTEVYKAEEVYTGDMIEIGPDLQIGYARKYRGSWTAALGGIDRAVVSDNTDAWCADHCIATDLVPGVLFANRPIGHPQPSLLDLGPTILGEFGVPAPKHLRGRNVFGTATATVP